MYGYGNSAYSKTPYGKLRLAKAQKEKEMLKERREKIAKGVKV